MKSMKGLGMGRVLGTIKRRTTSGIGGSSADDDGPEPQGETPEAIAARSVKQFCESGGPNSQGDEVLFLPPIVEAAESSPSAAAECARLIRKFLARDYATKPSYQYNAIMLLRILTDNPGATFTRNVDKKFVDTAKELLRSGRDPSVRQILMETLDTFEHTKAEDEGLAPLIEMWKREKERAYKTFGQRMPSGPPEPRTLNAPPFDPARSQNYFARSHSNKRGLPTAVELAQRLEEARTSAKLLEQVVTNTPPQEVLNSDLIKEFADRCQSASRTIQAYMIAENPPPDNDTMEALIDTNEQLQAALNQHQRAVLGARKQLGIGERSAAASPGTDVNSQPPTKNGMGFFTSRPPNVHMGSSGSGSAPPPPLPTRQKGKHSELYEHGGVPSGSNSQKHLPEAPMEDPFRDPQPEMAPSSGKQTATGPSGHPPEPRLAFEPYHPGGFSSTPRYAGPQDEDLGKIAMSGAVGGSSAGADKGAEEQTTAVKPKPAPLDTTSPPPARRYSSDDEDIYDSTPKRKEPMYRY